MERVKSFLSLFKQSYDGFTRDKIPMMGAALAYYTAFSIAPLLIIALGIVGMVFGNGGSDKVFESVRGIVGDNGAQGIQSMVQSAAAKPHQGSLATAIGVV